MLFRRRLRWNNYRIKIEEEKGRFNDNVFTFYITEKFDYYKAVREFEGIFERCADESGAVHLMAGSYSAIAYAEQVLDIQYIDRLENSFDSAVRGRIVFGAKVIKPEELVDVPVTDGGNAIA